MRVCAATPPRAAALLIQGSTCVYSRKVEYLHKLVYNALAAVASKRRVGRRSARAFSNPRSHLTRSRPAAPHRRGRAAPEEGGDAGGADEAEADDDVAAFLGLDDVLQGAKTRTRLHAASALTR